MEVAFERNLVVEEYPFLKSHVMSGKAVLPVAVIMEWLAHGALHNNPGFSFHGFDELRVYNGVVLDPGKPCPIKVISGKAGSGSSPAVRVELRGGFNSMKLHAAATAVLSTSLPAAGNQTISVGSGNYEKTVDEAYRDVLFHGPLFHAIEDVESSSADGIVATLHSAPSPSKWMVEPVRPSWIGDPLVLDGAFQLMILWSEQHLGELSLPNYLKNYRQYVDRFPETGVKAVLAANRKNAAAANADMEFIDDTGRVLATVNGYECTMSPSLRGAFEKRTLT